jgi:hypothetical protein
MNGLLHLVYIFALLASTLPTIAQDDESANGTVNAVFRAEPTTPLVGEPVQLELVVSLPPGFEIVEWPELPVEWGAFSVADAGETETDTSSDGSQTIRQNWTVRLWQPDDYETPETFIGYHTPGSAEVRRVLARPLFFTVESILDPGDLNLRPARPPIRFIYVPPWTVGLILIAGGVAANRGWERIKVRRETKTVEPEIELSSAQIAERQLAAVVELPSQYDQPGAISDALRQFIDTHFNLETLSLTLEEIHRNSALQGYLRESEWQALVRILTDLDRLRFAPARIDDALIKRYIEEARHWVAAVDLSSRGQAA